MIIPNGVKDDRGKRAWNATEFCCGISDSRPDDVAYLTGLIEETASQVAIERIFSIGLSNRGFMSYRLACESLPGLSAIVALAGLSYPEQERCASARPVSVLHIHGTDDEVVSIDGGTNPQIGEGSFPGAKELVRRWAERAGCELSAAEDLPRQDLDTKVDGSETRVTRYTSGCHSDLVVEYWEMESSRHVPSLAPDFAERILAWLFDPAG